MHVPRGTNAPTTISGRTFTGHALDQMQGRGVTPTAVESAIQSGVPSPGNSPGTFVHVFEDLKVVMNTAGDVITVIHQ